MPPGGCCVEDIPNCRAGDCCVFKRRSGMWADYRSTYRDPRVANHFLLRTDGSARSARQSELPSGGSPFMKTMLIVFHSLTGGTRQMAEAAARGGAAQVGVQVDLVEASKAGAADVLHADGYIFATPENLAA